MNEIDAKFQSQIQGAILTVQSWDDDPTLLMECRALIPFQELIHGTKYKKDDEIYPFPNQDFLLLQRLAVFFQKDFMTWVNSPPCDTCQPANATSSTHTGTQNHSFTMEPIGTRQAETPEEQEGRASRVEMYKCTNCQNTTTFPRYNSVRKLLETRKGRCGEYANLFGLFCRSLGFETRYVLDLTDHVWTEVWIPQANAWIMADSCEGVIDTYSMYEHGWGKKLKYILGISAHDVTDITCKYTRNFNMSDFQERRRQSCTSEQEAEQIISQLRGSLRQGLPSSRIQELDQRLSLEQKILQQLKQKSQWTEAEKHAQGRISGSLKWKIARGENGKDPTPSSSDLEKENIFRAYHVEQFYPFFETLEISVSSKEIIVAGVQCELAFPKSISLVTVDNEFLGCILQCRSFTTWDSLGVFLESVPDSRIVIIKGMIDQDLPNKCKKQIQDCLGGFVFPTESNEAKLVYIGQARTNASWTVCDSLSSTQVHEVKVAKEPSRPQNMCLRMEKNTVPKIITTRLPDSIMPLQTQATATETQKRDAFLRFVKQDATDCVGYTTKPEAPVYLLGNASFPFQPVQLLDERPNTAWTTFHFLPQQLVPDHQNAASMKDSRAITKATPMFDIPLDTEFFESMLGPQLLVNPTTKIDTHMALQNARLIGLYFSAHWCPPCRRFTPLLIEAYFHLKEEIPMHGLEIVFVSSDRDPGSFQNYYGSMPWLALPFQETSLIKQQISMTYGVRGIPSLVILDAMSGSIVATTDQSRSEVMRATQQGDQGVEAMFNSWLDRIPSESKELMNMLELSCQEEEGADADEGQESELRVELPYCVRNNGESQSGANDPATRIREIFAQLIAEGENPNKAAAKAIKIASKEQEPKTTSLEGAANVLSVEQKAAAVLGAVSEIKSSNPTTGNDAVHSVARIILKYIENAIRQPYNPKFRTFKLSNKVADKIVSLKGGLSLVFAVGLEMISSPFELLIRIPLSADLEDIKSLLEDLVAGS